MTVPRTLRWLGFLMGLLVAATLLAAAATAVLAVRVQGSSMAPTLADGQRVLVLPGTAGKVARFDVVVLTQPGTSISIVKRVIAVAGDAIAIQGDPALVRIRPGNVGPWRTVRNAAWLGQSHSTTPCCDPSGREQLLGGATVVPEGKLFVLGDNPDGSEDSRDFGWVDLASVQGPVAWSAWPPGGIRTSVSLR